MKRKPISNIKTKVVKDTKLYLNKMGSKKDTKITFSHLNTISAEATPKKIVYNIDYITRNKNKPSVLKNLEIHEASHVVTRSGDNSSKFIKEYQKISGNKNPQTMRGENKVPSKYIYKCPKCKRQWPLDKKPISKGYCSYCGTALVLIKR
jgi:DNA-directed RNA polymerase subunit RPC12/RpoP